ncbi:Protein GRD-15 [Aphelenchoides avenae]|nr:Protein GRD-15 [Aphelenchus avenae]
MNESDYVRTGFQVVPAAPPQSYGQSPANSYPPPGYGPQAPPQYQAPLPPPPPQQPSQTRGYNAPPYGAQRPANEVPQTPYDQGAVVNAEAQARGFPLPSCYVNKDGFMCCSKELENLMDGTYTRLSTSRNGKWKKCNLQQVANAIQKDAEARFGVSFETVAGAGDYASKINFSRDLLCKIRREAQ